MQKCEDLIFAEARRDPRASRFGKHCLRAFPFFISPQTVESLVPYDMKCIIHWREIPTWCNNC